MSKTKNMFDDKAQLKPMTKQEVNRALQQRNKDKKSITEKKTD
jgi:hypothetical protein